MRACHLIALLHPFKLHISFGCKLQAWLIGDCNAEALLSYHCLTGNLMLYSFLMAVFIVYWLFTASDYDHIFSALQITTSLHLNPQNEIDKIINSLRLKYRTYTVEFEVDCVNISFIFQSNICVCSFVV